MAVNKIFRGKSVDLAWRPACLNRVHNNGAIKTGKQVKEVKT